MQKLLLSAGILTLTFGCQGLMDDTSAQENKKAESLCIVDNNENLTMEISEDWKQLTIKNYGSYKLASIEEMDMGNNGPHEFTRKYISKDNNSAILTTQGASID